MPTRSLSTAAPGGGAMSREIKPNDEYLDRLYKLLPAEVTGAYIAIRTLIDPITNENDKYLFFFGGVILVLAPFVYYWVLKISDWVQVAFLTFSFVVWAANIDVVKIIAAKPASWADSAIAQFLLNATFIKGFLIIWVILLVPLVLRKPSERAERPARSAKAKS
jgi:hypothetical protein